MLPSAAGHVHAPVALQCGKVDILFNDDGFVLIDFAGLVRFR